MIGGLAAAGVALATLGSAGIAGAEPEPLPPWQPKTMTGLPIECESEGRGMDGWGEAYSLAWTMIGSALLPQTGARWTFGASPRFDASLSWPISIPFGPVSARVVHERRHCELTPRADELQAHRFVVEPGITFPHRTTGFVRFGYRAIWHRASRFVGLGAGVGTTLELFNPEHAPRPSVGGELLLHLGECCAPGYILVAARYDRFFAGAGLDVATLSLGLAFY